MKDGPIAFIGKHEIDYDSFVVEVFDMKRMEIVVIPCSERFFNEVDVVRVTN